jgi:hypothetical protein
VVVASRSQGTVNEVVATIARALGVTCDVGVKAHVERMVGAADRAASPFSRGARRW